MTRPSRARVGWGRFELPTSASRTNQPPHYQAIYVLHGTTWGPVGAMWRSARGQDVGKPRPRLETRDRNPSSTSCAEELAPRVENMIWQMGRDPHVPVVLLDDIPRPRFEKVAGRVATPNQPAWLGRGYGRAMGTSSPDTVSLAGHVDATAGDPVEVDDDGDAVALAVELLLEERDGVIDGGADIGIVDDAPPSSSDRRDRSGPRRPASAGRTVGAPRVVPEADLASR